MRNLPAQLLAVIRHGHPECGFQGFAFQSPDLLRSLKWSLHLHNLHKWREPSLPLRTTREVGGLGRALWVVVVLVGGCAREDDDYPKMLFMTQL